MFKAAEHVLVTPHPTHTGHVPCGKQGASRRATRPLTPSEQPVDVALLMKTSEIKLDQAIMEKSMWFGHPGYNFIKSYFIKNFH